MSGVKGVVVDDYNTNEVDLSDVEDFPKLDPPQIMDQCEVVLHILWERYYAACHPELSGVGGAWSSPRRKKAHDEAKKKQKAYRQSLNYTDWVDEVGEDGTTWEAALHSLENDRNFKYYDNVFANQR